MHGSCVRWRGRHAGLQMRDAVVGLTVTWARAPVRDSGWLPLLTPGSATAPVVPTRPCVLRTLAPRTPCPKSPEHAITR